MGPICGLFPIISLNDLSDAPHNILFKLFASKKKATINATKKVRSDLYNHLPMPLKDFLNDYINSAHFKKGCIFLALKGLNIPAQGNVLGNTLQ
jgi:hypothetical protein